jgi:preprotein translocase subunit SecE
VAEVVERVEAHGFVGRLRLYTSEVVAEMRRVTWPDKAQIRQLSIGVVVLSLVIGGIIAIIDVILQNVLVTWIPRLFGAG